MKSIRELANAHAGETARIIGKGPSLRHLAITDIGPGPVIAISESIITVERLRLRPYHSNDIGLPNESLYSLQKDLGNVRPLTCPVLLSFHESEKDLPGYEPSYVFNMCDDLHLPYHGWSAVAACEIARLMGCTALDYICCDVMTTGDMSTYDPLKGTVELVHGNYSPLPMALLHHLVSVGIKTTFTHPAAAVKVVKIEDHRAEVDRAITEKFKATHPKFVELCPPPTIGSALP